MRMSKIESVRRIVSNAAAQCDASQLKDVKRDLLKILAKLDELENGVKKAKSSRSDVRATTNLHDPKRTMAHIEGMIKQEMDKFSVNMNDVFLRD